MGWEGRAVRGRTGTRYVPVLRVCSQPLRHAFGLAPSCFLTVVGGWYCVSWSRCAGGDVLGVGIPSGGSRSVPSICRHVHLGVVVLERIKKRKKKGGGSARCCPASHAFA